MSSSRDTSREEQAGMSDERLNEMRERAKAATPGPWEAVLDFEHGEVDVIEAGEPCEANGWLSDPGSVVATVLEAYVGEHKSAVVESYRATTEFIAHARKDVPALLAELDLLREAYHHACAELARWRAWYGFADFGLTEAPDEQVQDVQDEFLGKARGVGA